MKGTTILSATALLLGLALIGGAVVLDQSHLGALLQRRTVPSEEVQSTARQFDTHRGCTTCMGITFVRDVEVVAPREMRIDESATIRFRYSDRRSQLAPEQNTVSFDFDVTLSGANFEVKPTETQKIVARAEGLGPASLAWTVKPKGTGSHVVTLNFAEMIQNLRTRQTTVITNVSGRKEDATSTDAIVELPIKVLSEWNVPSWVVSLVKAAFGLIGFVFVTPGVWWLFRQIQRSRSRAKPFRHRRQPR